MISKLNKIGIGQEYPVFFIAEAGVNHNGSLDIGLKLVEIAAKAGASALKPAALGAAVLGPTFSCSSIFFYVWGSRRWTPRSFCSGGGGWRAPGP